MSRRKQAKPIRTEAHPLEKEVGALEGEESKGEETSDSSSSSGSMETSFSCPFCLRLFKHKRSRDRHVKLHTGDKKYNCCHCDASFSRSDHLKIHLKTHDNGKPFQCVTCNRGYNTAAALTSHSQGHKPPPPSPPPPQTCPLCPLSVPLHLLPSHLLTAHPLEKFLCNQCPLGFSTFDNFRTHLRTHLTSTSPATNGNKTFTCTACDKIFQKPDTLQKHLMDVHAVYLFKCGVCGDIFDSKVGLQVHFAVKHSVEAEPIPIPCPNCPQKFSVEFLLDKHLGSCEPKKKKLSCGYCSETSKSRADLEQHMKSHGNKNKCNICDQIFSTATALAEHKLTHVKVQEAKCVCGVELKTLELYWEHMKNCGNYGNGSEVCCVVCRMRVGPSELSLHCHHHTKEEKKYHCLGCRASFSSELEIKSHITSEHSSTENVCHLCSEKKTFSSPLKLQSHLIEHNFEGCSYSCYLCSAVFTSSSGLQAHIVEHGLGARIYECECGGKFWWGSELENHRVGCK